MKLPPRLKPFVVYGESGLVPGPRIDFPEPITVHNGETLRLSYRLNFGPSGFIESITDVTTQIITEDL